MLGHPAHHHFDVKFLSYDVVVIKQLGQHPFTAAKTMQVSRKLFRAGHNSISTCWFRSSYEDSQEEPYKTEQLGDKKANETQYKQK